MISLSLVVPPPNLLLPQLACEIKLPLSVISGSISNVQSLVFILFLLLLIGVTPDPPEIPLPLSQNSIVTPLVLEILYKR